MNTLINRSVNSDQQIMYPELIGEISGEDRNEKYSVYASSTSIELRDENGNITDTFEKQKLLAGNFSGTPRMAQEAYLLYIYGF